jgi:hypothetical protein
MSLNGAAVNRVDSGAILEKDDRCNTAIHIYVNPRVWNLIEDNIHARHPAKALCHHNETILARVDGAELVGSGVRRHHPLGSSHNTPGFLRSHSDLSTHNGDTALCDAAV